MAFDMNKLENDIETLLNGSERIDIDINDSQLAGMIDDLKKARVRMDLSKKGFVVDFPKQGDTILGIRRITSEQKLQIGKPNPNFPEKKAKTPTDTPTLKRHQHSYVKPAIADDLISILTDDASHVVWLTGPTQCGKDRVVHYCGRELGREVVMINCRGDMGSEVFFGEKTITVDPATQQNVITFQKGLVEKAFLTGLDDQGNEVGAPAILCINEAASAPSNVMIGINRLLESDDARRTMVIDQDGTREVRSHSGLRIIFIANTNGRGAMGTEAMTYTAQTDALDISLLNRVAVCLRMGYDKEVERHILAEKICDDRVSALVLKFREAIRDHIKQHRLSSPFSTGRIVHIADMYRIFGDLGKALYYTTFEFLCPEEKAIYNEQAMAILGKDLLKDFTQKNVDYM